MEYRSRKNRVFLVSLLLAAVTLGVYLRALECNFVTFDDEAYVTENEHVQKGVTWEGIVWAFSFNEYTYWHPLTWLSHMLDCELYGVDASMHHFSSVLLHAANVVLLFLVLRLATGALWKSGFVAAVFALHPVNVDSVAWISERKNVLSTFFWMLTMLLYLYYCRRTNVFRYILFFAFFVLGLLSKPMLVTVPFVLLLLDYWPLGRISLGQKVPASMQHKKSSSAKSQKPVLWRLVLEKLPLLAIAFVSVYMSSASAAHRHDMISFAARPMEIRVENALVSYWAYLYKLIYPANLAVFYPFPKDVAD